MWFGDQRLCWVVMWLLYLGKCSSGYDGLGQLPFSLYQASIRLGFILNLCVLTLMPTWSNGSAGSDGLVSWPNRALDRLWSGTEEGITVAFGWMASYEDVRWRMFKGPPCWSKTPKLQGVLDCLHICDSPNHTQCMHRDMVYQEPSWGAHSGYHFLSQIRIA